MFSKFWAMLECMSFFKVQSLLKLIDTLTKIAEDKSGGMDGEFVNCRQHALFSLKLISKLLAHQNPQHFIKVIDQNTSVFIGEFYKHMTAIMSCKKSQPSHCRRTYCTGQFVSRSLKNIIFIVALRCCGADDS